VEHVIAATIIGAFGAGCYLLGIYVAARHCTKVADRSGAQLRKGKVIAIDSTLDEATIRMDIGQCSGYHIGEVVAITSPVA
jgi:hypothetical protein